MRILLYCFITLISFNTKGQQILQGVVIDASNNSALPGATIINDSKGTVKDSEGTATDAKGNFSLPIDSLPSIITISHVGYEPITLKINTLDFKRIILQSSDQHLHEVVVRASSFKDRLLEVPAAVNIISAQEIERNDGVSITPVLNLIPGIFMESGALNTNRISIRGIGSRTPYGTNRVKVYFNNIPLTNAEGESSLEDININSLQRIEILKGPSSSIYGAGLGGTINITAKTPANMRSFISSKTTIGSFGLENKHIAAGVTNKRGYNIFSLNDLDSKGFRENSEYTRRSIITNGFLEISENINLSYLGSFIDLKAFIPSSISKTIFDLEPTAAAVNWKEAKGYEAYKKGFFGISGNFKISNYIENNTSTFISFRDADEPRPFDILKEFSSAVGGRTTFQFEKKDKYGIQFGAEYYKDVYDWQIFENHYQTNLGNGSVKGGLLNNNSEDRSYYNVFLQAKYWIIPNLKLETGVNFNNTSYSLNDKYKIDNINQSGEYRFEPVFSPRLGLMYKIQDDWVFFTSVSHGYSVPSIEETLTPEGLINTEILPETGVNFEIGTKGHWFSKKLFGEISVYKILIKNLLVAKRVGPDQYIGVNAGKSIHDGLELYLNYSQKLNNTTTAKLFINLTSTNYRFEEFIDRAKDYSGNKISGFPNYLFNAGVDITTLHNLYLRSDIRMAGMAFLNDANTEENSNYNLLNLKIGYNKIFNDHFEMDWSIGVNNLLDTHYASMVLVNAVAFGDNEPRYYYPGAPGNYYLTLLLKYNF